MYDGIPDGLEQMKRTIISIALQTSTSPQIYKELTLSELREEIETFNAVVEEQKRNMKKR